MISANRSIGAIVDCVILIDAGGLFAQDWPQCRGPNRDGKVTGFTAPQTWPEVLVEKWKTTVGSGDGTPALVGDKLYVFARQGEEEVTLCLNASDGKQVWQEKYTAQAVKIEKLGDGFAAKELWSNPEVAPQFNTPVLKDGLLFGLSDRGNLFCINAESGQTAWIDAAAHGRGFAAMLNAGSCLVALPSTSELIAFKPADGEYQELAVIKVSDTPTYAHPIFAGNRIFVKDQDAVTMWVVK